MTGCEQLIEAFKIFGKYYKGSWPTNCENGSLYVVVDPLEVSQEDMARLATLSFTSDNDTGFFKSCHFGSA